LSFNFYLGGISMHTVCTTKHLVAAICFGTLFFLLAFMGFAQVAETDEGACAQSHGVWTEGSATGINGDGTTKVTASVTGPQGHTVLGAHAKGKREGDGEYTFSCTMNPPQPPTVANSEQRRCTPPGNDMSVESCSVNGTTVGCQYVNSKNAPVKLVIVGACFLKPSTLQSMHDSSFGSFVSKGRSLVQTALHLQAE
jgi:hypothetical protein